MRDFAYMKSFVEKNNLLLVLKNGLKGAGDSAEWQLMLANDWKIPTLAWCSTKFIMSSKHFTWKQHFALIV